MPGRKKKPQPGQPATATAERQVNRLPVTLEEAEAIHVVRPDTASSVDITLIPKSATLGPGDPSPPAPAAVTEATSPGAPFWYYGSKRRAAKEVWRRFGAPKYYIEPFGGSAAILLGRPKAPRHELLGDTWCYISNFWRAAKYAGPKPPARLCWHIPSEADLYARHAYLRSQGDTLEGLLRKDPKYYDPELAAWFAWGQSLWLGAGWCYQRKGRNPLAQNQDVSHFRGPAKPNARPKRQACDNPRGVLNKTGATVGDYLHDLISRVEGGKPSEWQEGLLKYFTALAYRLDGNQV
jgi:DNA adenine methylase